MNLINTFRETKIMKEDCELENKVNVLTELHNKYPNNEKIKDDLIYAKIGLNGEKTIIHELKMANIGMYVLHDITFKYEDLSAQTDFIVITPVKNYFIECKNLRGHLKINNTGSFTRKYESNNNRIEENIYSPLTQAKGHINIYKKIWDKNHGVFDKLLFEKDFFKFNTPLVVMANPKNILYDRFAPKEIKNKVIRADQLINYLEKDLKYCKWHDRLSQKGMEEKAKFFLDNNTPNIVNYRKIYLSNDEKILELRDNLIEFRNTKSNSRHIPKNYIFNDNELEDILSKLPKTTDELKYILPDIKIKYHGDEIISILNDLF